MKIEVVGRDTLLNDVTDFHLGQTLECGQCFHFEKVGENEYFVSAKGKLLHVKQNEDMSVMFYDTSRADMEAVWIPYFDLNRDYGEIKAYLRKMDKDNRLKEAMDTMWGIRILNQDFFETMISFIISQNKQIPHIKKIVADMSVRYGERYETAKMLSAKATDEGERDMAESGVLYAFPTVEAILSAGEEGVRDCKTGFRAPYIIDACRKYADGTLDEQKLRNMSYDEAISCLMQVKGIGEKVANCIALFGLGKRNAFPVDVWIKRTMESIYIGHEEPDKGKIAALAKELFGEYGGYAQQYLFYYGKELKIGK